MTTPERMLALGSVLVISCLLYRAHAGEPPPMAARVLVYCIAIGLVLWWLR